MQRAIIVVNHQLKERLLGLGSQDDGSVELYEDLFALYSKKCVVFGQKVEEYWNHMGSFIEDEWEKAFVVSWKLVNNHPICLWFIILWHHCVSKFLVFFYVLSHACIEPLQGLLRFRRSSSIQIHFSLAEFSLWSPAVDLKKKKTHTNRLFTK